jgi:hypothetical protein
VGIAGAQLAAPSPTRALNADCSDWPAGEACSSGLCLDVTLGKVCSVYCVSDEDCTNEDWRCRTITQGNGERISFCAPLRAVAP